MSTHFLEALIEAYLQRSVGRSATFTVEFLGFLGSQLQEFPELYFKALSGVNLDPVLRLTIETDPNNSIVVTAYSRFLDSLTQCLLKTTTPPSESQLAL